MLVKCWLRFLCILSTPQSSDSYKYEPIYYNCFKWIHRWFICQVQQSSEHSSGDGTPLSTNIFFSLPCKGNPCTHICTIWQITRNVKVAEAKQSVNCIDISMDCIRARVLIQHELLNEAHNNLVKARFVMQGSGIWFRFMKFTYTACLKLVVSRSESDSTLDSFASTISPKWARLAWELAGRKCRLSAPPVWIALKVQKHSLNYFLWKREMPPKIQDDWITTAGQQEAISNDFAVGTLGIKWDIGASN